MRPKVMTVILKDGTQKNVCDSRETMQCIYALEEQVRAAKEELARWKITALAQDEELRWKRT